MNRDRKNVLGSSPRGGAFIEHSEAESASGRFSVPNSRIAPIGCFSSLTCDLPQDRSQEIWKTFPEDPRCSASNLGRIKNNVTNRIIEGWLKKTKYNTYKCFRIGNSRTGGKVWHFHYVILSSFVPKPEGKYVCDHINRNTLDNRLENLRWVSCSANILNSDLRTLYCFYNGEYFRTFNGWKDAGHYFHRHYEYLKHLNRKQGGYKGFYFINVKKYRQMTGYKRFIVSY